MKLPDLTVEIAIHQGRDKATIWLTRQRPGSSLQVTTDIETSAEGLDDLIAQVRGAIARKQDLNFPRDVLVKLSELPQILDAMVSQRAQMIPPPGASP